MRAVFIGSNAALIAAEKAVNLYDHIGYTVFDANINIPIENVSDVPQI